MFTFKRERSQTYETSKGRRQLEGCVKVIIENSLKKMTKMRLKKTVMISEVKSSNKKIKQD